MDAKTLASLLPFFLISGVAIAGITSDDPYWYHNNFSQLGDRTTFAATLFNSTLILAGVCMIIISYFAVAELVTTHRLRSVLRVDQLTATGRTISRFTLRTTMLGILLVLSGIIFIGIGTFRYTPHPVLHNVFARSLSWVMSLLFIGLPWLAPQFSKAMYVISDIAIGLCYTGGVFWLLGFTSLTNVEAISGLLFVGWFVVFSRQIAAIEADRLQAQILYDQSAVRRQTPSNGGTPTDSPSDHINTTPRLEPELLESRLSANR